MTTLLGRIPANTFPTLLKIQRANDAAGDFDDPGIDSTLRLVEDGLGNTAPLKLSNTQVAINNMVWPTAAGTTGQVLQVTSGSQLGWVNLTTSGISEGSNLFWSQARFDSAFAAKTTTALAEGSNQYFTTARARAAISVTGSGSYNASTGVITVSGGVTSVNGETGAVVLDTTDVAEGSNQYFTAARARAAVSATGDLSYNPTTGVFSFSSAVTSVNSKTGAVLLTSSDIPEGSNQYFTLTRVRSAISVSGSLSYNSLTGVISYTTPAATVTSVNAKTGDVVLNSDDVAEGSSNLYFTAPRFDTSFSTKTTSDLVEGTNQYFTNSRAAAAAPVQSVFGRTGSVSLMASDVTTALGFSPLSSAGGTMTGDLTLSGDPTGALHAVTKQYVDNIASGLVAHQSVVTATTTPLTASYSNGTLGVGATLTGTGGIVAIGGVTPVLNDRILVKNQADSAQNGIYVVSAVAPNWILTRASDFDSSSAETVPGAFTYVQSGTLAGSAWVLTTTGSVTIGTTGLQFSQFAGAGSVTGGTGITVTGNSVSLADIGTAGTYTSVTTNSKGQVTSGADLTATGDATGTASGSSIALTLASVGTPVTSSLVKITTDAKGRVTDTTSVLASDLTPLLSSTYVDVTGDTMTGLLNLPTDGLAVGTSQLVVTGGRVGIGTNSPARPVHVVGVVRSQGDEGSSPIGQFETMTSDGNSSFIMRTYGSSSTGTLFGQTVANWSALYSAGATSQGMILGTQTGSPLILGTSATERMRIDSSGNVAIGTNPAGDSRLEVSDGSTATIKITPASTATTLNSRNFADTGWVSAIYNATQHIFRYAGTEAMRVNTVGNVGIGTATPTSKLDVVGTTSDISSRVWANNTTGAAIQQLVSGDGTTSANYAYTYYLNSKTASQSWKVGTYGNDNYTIRDETAAANRLIIDTSGNVGVGTTAPSVRLEVNGQIKSSSGGFVFPDGSVQTTASSSSATSVSMTNGDISSVTYTSSTTAANQVADTWLASTYRTATYVIQLTSGTSYQTSSITLIHNGTTVFLTEYAVITTGATLASFDADISSGSVRLLMTPVNATTVLKAVKTSVKV